MHHSLTHTPPCVRSRTSLFDAAHFIIAAGYLCATLMRIVLATGATPRLVVALGKG